MIPMLILNMGSGLFSMYYKLRGPNLGHLLGVRHLNPRDWRGLAHRKNGGRQRHVCRRSEATIVPLGLGGFCAMRALSTRNDDPQHASRPLTATATGCYGRRSGSDRHGGDGARKAAAPAFTRRLSATANTADANHMTAPAGRRRRGPMHENGLALRRYESNRYSYINAHGTSTPPGDIAETQAIKSVFGDHARKVRQFHQSATVNMLGAAGAVETIISVKAIEQKRRASHPQSR